MAGLFERDGTGYKQGKARGREGAQTKLGVLLGASALRFRVQA